MSLFDRFRNEMASLYEEFTTRLGFKKQKEFLDADTQLSGEILDEEALIDGQEEMGTTPADPIPTRAARDIAAYFRRFPALDDENVSYRIVRTLYSKMFSRLIEEYRIQHIDGSEITTLYFSSHQEWKFEEFQHSSTFVDQRTGQLRFAGTGLKAEARRALDDDTAGIEPSSNELVLLSDQGLILANGRFIGVDGTEKFYRNGVLHRVGGPAVIEVYANYDGPERHRSWYRNGALHRDDGPAVVGGRTTNGTYEWWLNGKRHRIDGPAIINLYEAKFWGRGPVYEWWRNGILAKIQDGDGILHYYKNGRETLREYPDGGRTSMITGRTENADGETIREPSVNYYNGYLRRNVCLNELYREPQSTFDLYNPYEESDS